MRPVILSGGSGSRLWPLSRESHPKQFLDLTGGPSLLQQTLLRVHGFDGVRSPLLVCNQGHRFLVAEQVLGLGVEPSAIILEPVARNTAPALAAAALWCRAHEEDPLLLVLPADHLIADDAGFRDAVRRAMPLAEAGNLVTFGVVPQSPETGYGYIKAGPAAGRGAWRVERFVEKPDAERAATYLADGGYYWNSGMFLLRASRYLEELEQFAPAMVDACRRALELGHQDLDFLRLHQAAFDACPADSIDYAVMERTATAVVVPIDVGWSDVGAWSAVWQSGSGDGHGNVTHGDTVLHGVRDSLVYADHRLVSVVGVQDLVVVETADAVLVIHRDRVQDVKSLVEELKHAGRPEASTHRKVYRPWGSYDSIDTATRFQVKRISVRPGASLSLQMHHHRAEHWVVVSGTARVTRGDEVFLLGENESTYIPLGVRHRLENPGKLPLELIEVQSGGYLGEDDIVRFEDHYGRESGD